MRLKCYLNVCSGDPHGYAFFWRPEYLNRYVRLTAGEYHDVVAGKMIFFHFKEDTYLDQETSEIRKHQKSEKFDLF